MPLSEKIAAWCVGTVCVGAVASMITLVCGCWCSDPRFVLGETVRLPGGGTAVVVKRDVATYSVPNYTVAFPGGVTVLVDENVLQKQETTR